jgi:hypothetical protein
MGKLFRFERLTPFVARTWPSARELGRALETNDAVPRAQLMLQFGDETARLTISDIWSACCELLLQAQLAREARLDHFIFDVEQVFDIAYDGNDMLCIFSREHLFAVDPEAFASGLEALVDEIFGGTSCPAVMRIAARWSASSIRAQPYSARFSDSVLT